MHVRHTKQLHSKGLLDSLLPPAVAMHKKKWKWTKIPYGLPFQRKEERGFLSPRKGGAMSLLPWGACPQHQAHKGSALGTRYFGIRLLFKGGLPWEAGDRVLSAWKGFGGCYSTPRHKRAGGGTWPFLRVIWPGTPGLVPLLSERFDSPKMILQNCTGMNRLYGVS